MEFAALGSGLFSRAYKFLPGVDKTGASVHQIDIFFFSDPLGIIKVEPAKQI